MPTNPVPQSGYQAEPNCRDRGHKLLPEPHLPVLRARHRRHTPPGQHLLSPSPVPLSCSVPLNLTINPPVTDTASRKGREAGAIYNWLCSPSEHGHLFQATCQRPTFPWLYIWAFPQASAPHPRFRGALGSLANQEGKPALSLRNSLRGSLCRGLQSSRLGDPRVSVW